jgi:hypothetical protein
MLAAVVPVQNEEERIQKTLETLLALPAALIIPVINGSSDLSCRIIHDLKSPHIFPLHYRETLGIDVPRAIGARTAKIKGATAVLFLDGDMNGEIEDNLRELIRKVEEGADMALTNCYPAEKTEGLSPLATKLLHYRRNLNREIGLEQALGSASPSHGPHAVSSRFLAQVPLVELAIPPVSLALAAKGGLKVCVGTTIPHKALGSPAKDASHSKKIAATIIGDCLEAICVYRDKLRSRSSGTVDYDGYHSQRRLDLLNKYLNQVEHP